MEEYREQAPPTGNPGVSVGAAAASPAPVSSGDYGVPAGYAATPAVAPPGRLAVAGRLFRLIGLRLYAGTAQVFLALRPHAGWLAVITMLLGVIVVQTFLMLLPRMLPATTADTRVTLIAPPQAVTSFLEGQSTYNADLIWDAFSPELQANLSARGSSRDSIAAQVEDERLAGLRYRSIAYIGGVQVGERSRYYYLVNIDSPQPEQAGSYSFIFTVNRDGKIIGIQRE